MSLPPARSLVCRVAAPPDAVFDYLADVRNRPEWQASLRAVELHTEHSVGVGTRWRDLTWAGIAPTVEVTVHDRPGRWAEEGCWRGIRGRLALAFAESGGVTEVTITARLSGTGIWRAPAALAGPLMVAAVRRDLRRVDRILASP